MKKVNIIATVLLVSVLACTAVWNIDAQQRTVGLKFDAELWDFGPVSEADGIVSHTFGFVNVGRSAVIIERVNSDCGCTVPEYDHKPIKPGEKGSITVRMNPEGYSGVMRKYVTVIWNDGKQTGRNTLCMTADVAPRQRTVEEDYPLALPHGLRAANLNASFEYLSQNAMETRRVEIVNNSEKVLALAITSTTGSGLVKAEAPGVLQPGEKSAMTFTYDLTSVGEVYGAISDRIYFSVNGTDSSLPVSTGAIIVDDFAAIESGSAAAHARISPVFHNFRTASPGQTLVKEFTITNTGNDMLYIRDVTARRNTAHDLRAGTAIEPGDEVKVTIRMTVPQDAEGTLPGGITMIVNDPDRPLRDIRTVVEVEKQGHRTLKNPSSEGLQ